MLWRTPGGVAPIVSLAHLVVLRGCEIIGRLQVETEVIIRHLQKTGGRGRGIRKKKRLSNPAASHPKRSRDRPRFAILSREPQTIRAFRT